MQAVLICMVFARNLTKCGNKGKYGRQAALHSLMVGRRARGQGLGGPYHGGGGGGGRLTRNTEACIRIPFVYVRILLSPSSRVAVEELFEALKAADVVHLVAAHLHRHAVVEVEVFAAACRCTKQLSTS